MFSEKQRLERKKILLIQTAFIGDVVLITPLIREIKKYISQFYFGCNGNSSSLLIY